MANTPTFHPVYRSMNRLLTVWGIERRLFLLALIIAAATFTLFSSLLAGILMFLLLAGFGRWASANDTQILRTFLNSSRFRTQYDPAKRGSPDSRATRGRAW